ncbi:hypothetical protein NDU88_003176 [Pleurodeles waltl]|uniref:Uncharacterized protein n=1 Tax=Pleurodeles waltl TaxID=8319 RepID=A0AAV7LEH9_PLEWA|nr:hypothetical protein NDU88_003176 [Pleurodeles waltl]
MTNGRLKANGTSVGCLREMCEVESAINQTDSGGWWAGLAQGAVAAVLAHSVVCSAAHHGPLAKRTREADDLQRSRASLMTNGRLKANGTSVGCLREMCEVESAINQTDSGGWWAGLAQGAVAAVLAHSVVCSAAHHGPLAKRTREADDLQRSRASL